MATFRESKIVDLSPNVGDGSNRVFFTPTQYRTGTIRVFANGIMYGPADDYWGWTEDGMTSIELINAPRVGDVLAAFYQEDDGLFAGDEVLGSPYAPGEV